MTRQTRELITVVAETNFLISKGWVTTRIDGWYRSVKVLLEAVRVPKLKENIDNIEANPLNLSAYVELASAVGTVTFPREVRIKRLTQHLHDEIYRLRRDLGELEQFHSELQVALEPKRKYNQSPMRRTSDGLRIKLPKSKTVFRKRSRAASPPPLSPNGRTFVTVYYATDRQESRTDTDEFSYGKYRSENGLLHYGVCSVSIPKIHKMGVMETPWWIWTLLSEPDPEKYLLLADTKSLPENEFYEAVATAISHAPAMDAFVFVHGYNVSFEDAARRVGQIAFDLNFCGVPILYSWPSKGTLAAYIRDETDAEWSVPHFEEFLTLVAARTKARRIHVIAHSMGNRIVCQALKDISSKPGKKLKLQHLVLAAPDIDADTMRQMGKALSSRARKVTLYASSNDKALIASKLIHGYLRAGEPLLLMSGVDTIDASAVDTDFLGHSIVCDNVRLLSDVHSLVTHDHSPNERFELEELLHDNNTYYAFRKA